jgi:hypothetical protein
VERTRAGEEALGVTPNKQSPSLREAMRARRVVQHNLCAPDGCSENEWRAQRQKTIRIIERLPATYLDPDVARIAIDCVHAGQYVGSLAEVSFLCSHFFVAFLFYGAFLNYLSASRCDVCAYFSCGMCFSLSLSLFCKQKRQARRSGTLWAAVGCVPITLIRPRSAKSTEAQAQARMITMLGKKKTHRLQRKSCHPM